jgi:hypothetical protein
MPISGIPTNQYMPNRPSIAWIVGREDIVKSLKTNKIVNNAKMLTTNDNAIDIRIIVPFFPSEKNNPAEQGASNASATIDMVSAILTGSERNCLPVKKRIEQEVTITRTSMQKGIAR